MTTNASTAEAALQDLWSAVHRDYGPARQWHLSNLTAHAQRYLADLRLVAGLAPVGSIIDVGAAPCHMTALLQRAGYPVIGVDIAPQRVARLIDDMRLDVRQCDIERSPLPFSDEPLAKLAIQPNFSVQAVREVGGRRPFLA